MRYRKAELVDELHAVARVFGGERRARLLAAAEFIDGGSTARTPQREIARRLDAAGVDFDLEITLASAAHLRSGTFRADIGIYRGDHQLVALCECKPWKRSLTGRQRKAYDGCGLPYIVAGMDSIDEAVAWLMEKARG